MLQDSNDDGYNDGNNHDNHNHNGNSNNDNNHNHENHNHNHNGNNHENHNHENHENHNHNHNGNNHENHNHENHENHNHNDNNHDNHNDSTTGFEGDAADNIAVASADTTDDGMTMDNLTGSNAAEHRSNNNSVDPATGESPPPPTPPPPHTTDESVMTVEALSAELEAERQRSDLYEQKLKLALADFQNLSRKKQYEVESGVVSKLGGVMTDLLDIRDNFVRARDAFASEGVDTGGLDSILKNMDAMLKKHDVTPIDALGEIFDPNIHEAISTEIDPALDESTVTQEIRRGYMLKNTVIRPALVVISQKEG